MHMGWRTHCWSQQCNDMLMGTMLLGPQCGGQELRPITQLNTSASTRSTHLETVVVLCHNCFHMYAARAGECIVAQHHTVLQFSVDCATEFLTAAEVVHAADAEVLLLTCTGR